MKQDWLSLAEYSIRHKVSISTLRRRIKAEDIQFRLEDGKYLILDNQETTSMTSPQFVEDRFDYSTSSPSQANPSSAMSVTYNYDTADQFKVENIVKKGHERKSGTQAALSPSFNQAPNQNASSGPAGGGSMASTAGQSPSATAAQTQNSEATESVLTAANRLLTDLKKAYTQVLQEKEQVIAELREEVSDLKTLIKVLESENDRLRDLKP